VVHQVSREIKVILAVKVYRVQQDHLELPAPKDHQVFLAYKALLDLLDSLEREDLKVFLVHRVAKAM